MAAIPGEQDRLVFQRRMRAVLGGTVGGLGTATSASVMGSQMSGSLGSFDQAVLETARRDLTVYLGPIAKVLVKQAAAKARTSRELYQRLARRPYPWLASCAEEFAAVLSRHVGRRVAPTEILFDAPPVKLEVQFQIEIYFRKEAVYHPLGDVSPVVQALAREQFDDYVKRVRVFGHPRVAADLKDFRGWNEVLSETLERMD